MQMLWCTGVGVAVWRKICWFGLLFAVFRGRPLHLSLGRFCNIDLTPSRFLSVAGALLIERSRVAIGAGMGEILSQGLVGIEGVVTFDVLPGITCFAIDSVPVIVREVTDTLNCVRFFLDRRLKLIGGVIW